jgi:hypothetical protein
MNCTIVFLAQTWLTYTLDHVEPKSEVQAEKAQVEDLTNLALDQDKP